MPFNTPTMGGPGGPSADLSQGPGVPGPKDPNIKVSLENVDLWRRFNDMGTEMIITKTGRYEGVSFGCRHLHQQTR